MATSCCIYGIAILLYSILMVVVAVLAFTGCCYTAILWQVSVGIRCSVQHCGESVNWPGSSVVEHLS